MKSLTITGLLFAWCVCGESWTLVGIGTTGRRV